MHASKEKTEVNKTFQLARATAPLHCNNVKLFGDKSLAHRAMLLSALARGKSIVSNFPSNGVTNALMRCLKALGVEVAVEDNVLTVVGNDLKSFKNQDVLLDCGNSATTMRLLVGTLLGTNTRATVDGSVTLRKRPVRVDQLMKTMGFSNFKMNEGSLPMRIHRRVHKPFDVLPRVETNSNSAQVKSAALLAALGFRKRLVLVEPLRTRDHTERMLQSMGAVVTSIIDNSTLQNVVTIESFVGHLKPLEGAIPGDISSAAFILAAAALVPKSEVTIKDVLLNCSRTGFLEVLKMMGCQLSVEVNGKWCGEMFGSITLKSPAVLKHVDISDPQLVVDMIDEFPVVAALMAHANGISTVRNAKELRYKESDRISSILKAYKRLGLQFHEYEDGFSVNGSKNLEARAPIETFNDHRIAMAFSLLGLVGDVAVDNGDIINESFPTFAKTLNALRT